MTTSIDGILGIILKKNLSRDAPRPIPLNKISYSIIARQSDGCELECNRIRAKILDNHYLITNTDTLREQWVMHPVAIFDMNQLKAAEDEMYETARQVARERASFYKATTIEDMTHLPVIWPKQSG